MNEIAREIPIVERVADMHEAPEREAERDKDRKPQERREDHVIRQAEMDHGKARHRDRQPHHAEDEDQRIQKESAVAPRHDEIFDHGAGEDEFHQRGDPERKAPPVALGYVGAHEVVPAEPVKVGRDAPVRAKARNRPACHRPVGRNDRRRDLALHVPGLLEPRHFADETVMLTFRSDRLVACHLHETTLAQEFRQPVAPSACGTSRPVH